MPVVMMRRAIESRFKGMTRHLVLKKYSDAFTDMVCRLFCSHETHHQDNDFWPATGDLRASDLLDCAVHRNAHPVLPKMARSVSDKLMHFSAFLV